MKFVTNFKNWSEVKFYLHVMIDKLGSEVRHGNMTTKQIVFELKKTIKNPSELFISHSEIISFGLPDTECEILDFDYMRGKIFPDRDAGDPTAEYFTKEINKRLEKIIELTDKSEELLNKRTKPTYTVWWIILIIGILYAITKSLSGV